MKFTVKTTLNSVSFASATLSDEALGGFSIECKTQTGRYMRELAPFFGKAGAVRITFEADEPAATAPPVVDHHPSCCEKAKSLFPRWIKGAGGWHEAVGEWFTFSGETCCEFCPFCGAKLPEVPR
jgi:hypothetical protein